MSETKKSIYKVGMWASLLIGVMYIVVGILLPLDPAERYRGEEFYHQISINGTIPMTWRLLFTIIGILTVFWITAANVMVDGKEGKLVGLYKNFIILGYAGAIMSSLEWYRELFLMQNYMATYAGSEYAYQISCQFASVGIDPNFIWKFGGLGLWYFLNCFLLQKNKMCSKAGNRIGMIAGLSLIASMIFAMTDTIVYFPNGMQMTVMQMTALLGGVLGGIYHIIMFFNMHKELKNS